MYFVLFQFIGAAFAMALFTGVLVNYFAENSGSGILTRRQKEWVHAKLLVKRAHAISEIEPGHPLRSMAFDLFHSRYWQPSSLVFILIQVVVIVMVRFPQAEWQEDGLAEFYVNLLCLCWFTFEIVVGMLALGAPNFLSSGWNKFDVVVVGLSWSAFWVEQVVAVSGGGDVPLVQVQALRATRIVRVMALFKGSEAMKALFAALVLSIPAVINITLLMLLVFFVFAVIGLHMYSEMPFGEYLNADQNFSSTASIMKLLFEVVTGHDFLYIIDELQQNADSDQTGELFGGSFSFFFLFYIAGKLVLVNLFIAMLMENVQISLASENSIVQAEHCDAFKKEWDAFVQDDARQTIRRKGQVLGGSGDQQLHIYDLFDLVGNKLDEPLSRIKELDHWEHRLLLELGVGLECNRRQTHVTFQNSLISICVLFLGLKCLPYELQHERMLDLLHQEQKTATRLIQSKISMKRLLRHVPESIDGLGGDKILLDTDVKKKAFRTAVRVFGDLAYNHILWNSKIRGMAGDEIRARGIKSGQVKVRFEWVGVAPPDADTGLPWNASRQLLVTALETKELTKMDTFGENDVYCIVSVNSSSHRTKTVDEGGAACQFTEKDNNQLLFRHLRQVDSIFIRVFDEDRSLLDTTDDEIGCSDNLALEVSGVTLMEVTGSSHSLARSPRATRFAGWGRAFELACLYQPAESYLHEWGGGVFVCQNLNKFEGPYEEW